MGTQNDKSFGKLFAGLMILRKNVKDISKMFILADKVGSEHRLVVSNFNSQDLDIRGNDGYTLTRLGWEEVYDDEFKDGRSVSWYFPLETDTDYGRETDDTIY